MKLSKLSLFLLSGLLVTQATMPMENPANSALKKAQKAGKLALKIGAGTATLGIYAIMGTAALASWGITIGAAGLSLARFLASAGAKTPVTPEAPKATVVHTPKNQIKRPPVSPPARSENPPKNSRAARYTHGIKAAGLLGLAAVENELLDVNSLEGRMTHEQVAHERKKQALHLQSELEKCHEQSSAWKKDYSRTYHAELPRFEGPYQDMIGIYDGDLEDMRAESRLRMQAKLDHHWQQSGCAKSMHELSVLARRMAQDQMRLPKNV